MKKNYGTFGVGMRAYGQKLVKFCTYTDTRGNLSSIDINDARFRTICPGRIGFSQQNFVHRCTENMKPECVEIS